ncbi:metal ABC transporter permease [Acidobacteriota bacterium]
MRSKEYLLPARKLLGLSVIIFSVSFCLIPLAVRLIPSLPEAVAFMALPFLACLILTGIHTYLGVHVIARGVIFVDLCLAQIAALGTLYAFLLGYAMGSWHAYVISLLFTFIGAVIFSFGKLGGERVPLEAVIGIVYAVATAASLLILSRAPHEAEHIRDILTGSILWVDQATVIKTAKIYGLIGVFQTALYPVFTGVSFKDGKKRTGGALWDLLFYMSFGFVITSSVAIAGVLLVFSFLVIPAVIAMLFAESVKARLGLGWLVGTAASVVSLFVSYRYDLPSGPCVVTIFGFTLLVLAGLRSLLGPKDSATGRGA